MTGQLGFLESWDWDLSASLGNVNQRENQFGNVSRSAFEQLSLADDHGASICGSAINPFGIESISPECAAFFTKSATNETTIRQSIVDGFVTGPVFEMPAGEAQVALGYLYKSDDYAFLPDASLTATSPDPVNGSSRVDIVGFNAQDVVRGRTISREVYGEIRLPLLSDVTGIRALDFIGGYRIADHNVAGNISSYKGEFIWDVTDELGFRGGYQRAVRAPNINELFRPATINFPAVGLGDPCSNNFSDPDGQVQGAPQSQAARDLCIAQGIPAASLASFSYGNNQFEGLSGGNPNLSEETADTFTFGTVWRGEGEGVFGNFQASVDFYQIEIEDAINSIDADVFVERCFNPAFNPGFDNSNQFCQLFERNAGTGNITNALEVDTNLSVIEVRGIDYQVDYAADVGPGTFTGKLVATNLLDWEQAITAADPLEQFAGTASSDFDVLPEWKTTLSLGYAIGGFDGDVRMRYVGDSNDTSITSFKLDTVTYLDLNVAYSFDQWAEGLRVNAGVTNLTDEDPIIYPSNQQSNTDPATYDILGRRYFVNLTYSFR